LRRNKLNNCRSENRKYRYAERKAMPLTKLDITAALIVIDLQKGVVGLPTVHPTTEIVARTARLARAFRERGQLSEPK
jgi:DUF1009 family protein